MIVLAVEVVNLQLIILLGVQTLRLHVLIQEVHLLHRRGEACLM